jgi:hypothetical protein
VGLTSYADTLASGSQPSVDAVASRSAFAPASPSGSDIAKYLDEIGGSIFSPPTTETNTEISHDGDHTTFTFTSTTTVVIDE